MGDTPSDDEEEEVEESFWGDEIVEKWGSFKSVLPAATVTGAAAFVQRESKAVLLFKDLAASIPGEEPVLVFVSWEPAKKVSMATLTQTVQSNYAVNTIAVVKLPCTDGGVVPIGEGAVPLPKLIAVPLNTVFDGAGVMINHALVRFVALARRSKKIGAPPTIIAHAVMKATGMDWSDTTQTRRRIHEISTAIELFDTQAAGSSVLWGRPLSIELADYAEELYENNELPPDHEITLRDLPVLLESACIKLTPMTILQYFGACITDLRSPALTLKEMGFMMLCLASASSQTFLLPQDMFFLADPRRVLVTGNAHILGTLDVQALYCLMHAIGSPVSVDGASQLLTAADTERKGAITYEQFYPIWKKSVKVSQVLRNWGFPKSSKPAALDAAVNSEWEHRQREFRESVHLAQLCRSKERTLGASASAPGLETGKRVQREIRKDWYRRTAETTVGAKRDSELLSAYVETSEALKAATTIAANDRVKAIVATAKIVHAEGEAAVSKLEEVLVKDRVDASDKGLLGVPEVLWKTEGQGLQSSASVSLLDIVILDLSHNLISDLPGPFLAKLGSSLKKLDMSNNSLLTVPSDIGGLVELWMLNLKCNKLTALPYSIGGMRRLRWMDVSGNELTEFPEGMRRLTELKKLFVVGNQLTSFPDSFSPLHSLLELNLSSNKLTSLPPSLSLLPLLANLNVSWNSLRFLPDEIGRVRSLTYLNASNNKLRELTPSIGDIVCLQQLLLGGNNLKTLPVPISKLCNMMLLDVSNNQLKALPASLGGASSLQLLDLKDNCLHELPASIGLMGDLQLCYLRHNFLESIPIEIAACRSLRILDISENDMTGSPLPSTIGLLRGLQELNLSKNKVFTLTNSLKSVLDLHTLNLSWNGLTELPGCVCLLPSLTELDVSNNRLSSLPALLSKMSSITKLDVSANVLLRFPAEKGSWAGLQHLLAPGNLLKDLPFAFAPVLSRLHTFDCSRNPMEVLPPKFSSEAVAGGVQALPAASASGTTAPFSMQQFARAEQVRLQLQRRDRALQLEAIEVTNSENLRRSSLEGTTASGQGAAELGSAVLSSSSPTPAGLGGPAGARRPSRVSAKGSVSTSASPSSLATLSGPSRTASPPLAEFESGREAQLRARRRSSGPLAPVAEFAARASPSRQTRANSGAGAAPTGSGSVSPTPLPASGSTTASGGAGIEPLLDGRTIAGGQEDEAYDPLRESDEDNDTGATGADTATATAGLSLDSIRRPWRERTTASHLRALAGGSLGDVEVAHPRLMQLARGDTELSQPNSKWNLSGYSAPVSALGRAGDAGPAAYSGAARGDRLPAVVPTVSFSLLPQDVLDRRQREFEEMQHVLNARQSDRIIQVVGTAGPAHDVVAVGGASSAETLLDGGSRGVEAGRTPAAPRPNESTFSAIRPSSSHASATFSLARPAVTPGFVTPSTLSVAATVPGTAPAEGGGFLSDLIPLVKAESPKKSRRKSTIVSAEGVHADAMAAMALASQSHGYSSVEVAQYIAVNWLLRPHLQSEWARSMEYHFTDPSSCLAVFVAAVRSRVGADWKPEYIAPVETFYFNAMKEGVMDMSNLTPAETAQFTAAQARLLEFRAKRKDRVVAEAKLVSIEGRQMYAIDTESAPRVIAQREKLRQARLVSLALTKDATKKAEMIELREKMAIERDKQDRRKAQLDQQKLDKSWAEARGIQ